MNLIGYNALDILVLYTFIKENYPPEISTRNDKNTIIKANKKWVLESFEEIKRGAIFEPGRFNEVLKSLNVMVPGIWKSLILPFSEVPTKLKDPTCEIPILTLRLKIGQ